MTDFLHRYIGDVGDKYQVWGKVKQGKRRVEQLEYSWNKAIDETEM